MGFGGAFRNMVNDTHSFFSYWAGSVCPSVVCDQDYPVSLVTSPPHVSYGCGGYLGILGVRVFGNSASGVPIWFVGPLCVFCDAWATRIDLGFASKSKVRSRGGRSSAGFRGGFFWVFDGECLRGALSVIKLPREITE